ncbi:MAG: LCP family protein [Clostridia bacterium]
MSNRGYNGRRRKRRITGRFYAFLTVVLVLCIFVGVLISNNNRKAQQRASTFTPAVQANTNVVIPAPTVPPVSQAATDPVAPANPAADLSANDAAQTGSDTNSIDALMQSDEELAPVSEDEKVNVTDLAVTPGLSDEWRNILLLGTDARDVTKVERIDTIMIASINVKNGRVKMVSIMRDLVVPVETKKGVKEMKVNAIPNYGGADLVMKTINQLFGMNITEYVMVNFASFQKVVDILGGVRVDVSAEEMAQINISLGEQAKAAGYDQQEFLAKKDEMMLKTFGNDTLLTGIQALGYSRIRHVGAGDYQRVERQRAVLDSILKKVQEDANAVQLMQLASAMWGELSTNINLMNAVSIATTVIKNGATKLDMQWRIPGKDENGQATFKGEVRKGVSALWDCDFETNKRRLHTFIYES